MKCKTLSCMQRAGCGRPAATFARLSMVVFFICSLLAASAGAAPSVYVVTLSQQFGTVDLANGQFTPIGSPTPDGMSNLVWWNGSLLSLATTGANAGYLVKIDPATGDETLLRAITVNGQPLGFNAFALAKADERLYVTDFSNNLYSVDFATGDATPVGPSGGTTGLRPDPNVPFTFNSDGTFNLCDEGLYGFDGKLYATFDSYAIDPSQTPPTRAHEYMSPYVWQIDPRSGAATFVANTDWQVSAIVEVEGKFYAFENVFDGFDFGIGFPIAHAELVTLDLKTGKTHKVADIDPSVGPIFGAAPVRR
jgi:hypothetical protein